MKLRCIVLSIFILNLGLGLGLGLGCGKKAADIYESSNPLIYLGKYGFQTRSLNSSSSSEPFAFDANTDEPFKDVMIDFSNQTANFSRTLYPFVSPMYPVCRAQLQLNQEEIQTISLALQNIDLCQKKKEVAEIACPMFLPANYLSIQTDQGEIDLQILTG